MKAKDALYLLLFYPFLFGLSGNTIAQEKPKETRIVITDSLGAGLPSANVFLDSTGTSTNRDGEAYFSGVPDGIHDIIAQYLGYEKNERQIEIRDGIADPDTVYLRGNPIEMAEVEVVGDQEELRKTSMVPVTSLDQETLGKIPASHDDLRVKLNYTTPDYHDRGMSLQEATINGGDLTHRSIEFNGIQLSELQLAGYGSLLPSTEDYELWTIGLLPEEYGPQLVKLKISTKFDYESWETRMSLNHMTLDAAAKGPMSILHGLGIGDKEAISIAYRHHVLPWWNIKALEKTASHRNQLLWGYGIKDGANEFGNFIVYDKGKLDVSAKNIDISQITEQFGSSFTMALPFQENLIEAMLVFNSIRNDYTIEDGFLGSKKLSFSADLKNTQDLENGTRVFGFHIGHDRYGFSLDPAESLLLPHDIRDTDYKERNRFVTMPLKLFFRQEIPWGPFNFDLGGSVLTDLTYFEKGVAPAWYLGAYTGDGDLEFRLVVQRRHSLLDFDPLETGNTPDKEDYRQSPFETSDQYHATLTWTPGDFEYGGRLAYVQFSDQFLEGTNDQEILLTRNEIVNMSLRRELYNNIGDAIELIQLYNPQLPPDDPRWYNIHLSLYQQAEEELSYYYGSLKEDRNRHAFFGNLWMTDNQEFFASITAGRVAYGFFPVDQVNKPYKGDANLIAKVLYAPTIIGDREKGENTVSLSGHAQFISGLPWSPMETKDGLGDRIDLVDEEGNPLILPPEVGSILDKEWLVPGEGNSARYPNRITTTWMGKYDINGMFGTALRLSIALGIIDPQFYLMEPNVEDYYYKRNENGVFEIFTQPGNKAIPFAHVGITYPFR